MGKTGTRTALLRIRYMPAIIRFLGYNPLPEATSTGQKLVRRRTPLGMTRKEAVLQLGVDSETLARWERSEREPAGPLLTRVTRFLDDDGAAARSRRAG